MTDEEKKEEQAPAGLGAGDNNAPTPLITEAVKAAERMEKATAELKRENDRREYLQGREILGGKSAGNAQPQVKEETPKEYAKRVMAGKL